MANYYVRSAAAGSADGSSWANAYTSVAAAISGKAAGDQFFVADDHAEAPGGAAITWTSPGTASNPIRIICVNTHVTEPPTAKAASASATVTNTGANAIGFGAGYAYVYGIIFSCGTGSSAANINFATDASGWEMESCKFILATTSVSSLIALGSQSTNSTAIWINWKNCGLKFGSTAQTISLRGSRSRWTQTATAIDTGGSLPTSLITPSGTLPGTLEVSAVDLVALGSTKNLVSIVGAAPHHVRFRNCKLGPSVTPMTGTISGPGATEVAFENCHAGDIHYWFEQYKYQGSIKAEATKIKTSGASDGTTTISHAMAALSAGPTLFSPLEGPWLKEWNETLSSITVTVDVCTENIALNNDQCWLEVEYLGTNGFPLAVYTSSRAADAFATPAALTSSAASWSGFSTSAPQKMSLTFTPAEKGLIRARVCVAKPGTALTVYVDPQIQVGSGPTISRSYTADGYMNETGSVGSGGAPSFGPGLMFRGA